MLAIHLCINSEAPSAAYAVIRHKAVQWVQDRVVLQSPRTSVLKRNGPRAALAVASHARARRRLVLSRATDGWGSAR